MAEPKVWERGGEGGLATVNEAAFVAGTSARAVNQAIDRKEILVHRMRKRDASGRAIGPAEIVYLCVNWVLSPRARKAVYRVLAGLDLDDIPPVLVVEGVGLDIREPLAEVRSRFGEIEQIRERVHADPEIRGGEPVFRGTRVPVLMIAEFLRKGVPHAELLEDYPSLDEASLEVAARYAELYPPRGRPKEAPWRSQEPTHRFKPEALR